MAGGWGATHRWTQKGGEMLAVESRRQVLIPPRERGRCSSQSRGEGGMVTQHPGPATALPSTQECPPGTPAPCRAVPPHISALSPPLLGEARPRADLAAP